LQKDVAARVALTPDTILNWENNACPPSLRFLPSIIALLGFDPHPAPGSYGEHIVAKRRELGGAGKRRARGIEVEVVRNGRYITFQMPAVVIPRTLFAETLRLIDGLWPAPLPA
jgi:DNA-binding XRE family transcriptional regulator